MSIASIHLEMEGVHTFAEIRNMKEREGGREMDGGRERGGWREGVIF